MSARDAAGEVSPAAFRDVLGSLPTGVVIVTADDATQPVGMSCNSFTSVSLEPPLVSFCAANTSTTWPRLRTARTLCVNVLASHHEEASRGFSRRDVDRFAGHRWHRRATGPGLDDAVAWIDCRIEQEHDAGDHVIVVARVLALEAREDAEALVFWRGRYGSFAAHAKAAEDDAPGLRP